MEWALWGKLEAIWPCWVPFLAGLSLTAVLRTWYALDRKRERKAWMAELDQDFELWLRKRHVNGTEGSKPNGASS